MQRIAIEEIVALPQDATSRQQEFAAFVQRQTRFAFRIAYALLRNADDAEDVVQETFLKLYRNRAWRGLRDEKAFLARCTWRLAHTCRGRVRATETLAPDLTTLDAGPEQQAVTANSMAHIHCMIDALPKQLRQPLALSAIEELNSREIAAILGIPQGTVRTRLQRARQMLKQKMAREEVRHGQ